MGLCSDLQKVVWMASLMALPKELLTVCCLEWYSGLNLDSVKATQWGMWTVVPTGKMTVVLMEKMTVVLMGNMKVVPMGSRMAVLMGI